MLKNVINVIKGPFNPVTLNQVIFFITAKCNLRCQHCFYWRNINKQEELSLSEITKISKNLPQFNFLLISGGEPFLRKDIVEIIKIFKNNNKILAIGIPTNGTLTKTIIKKIKQILTINPKLDLHLYFSLDGTRLVHDEIRRVKGSFNKVIKSLNAANKLKSKYSNLNIYINTTITSKNITNIKKLIAFVNSKKQNFIDGHYFEIIRGSPRFLKMKTLNKENLRKLYDNLILPYQEKLWRQRRGNKFLNILLANFAKTNNCYIYKTQYNNFINGKAWSMPCLAGQSSIVINHRGDLQLCELRRPIVNLRNENYNAIEVLNGKKGKKELKTIKKDKCFCTHVCFITGSMYYSPKVVFKEIPLLWLKNLYKCSVEE